MALAINVTIQCCEAARFCVYGRIIGDDVFTIKLLLMRIEFSRTCFVIRMLPIHMITSGGKSFGKITTYSEVRSFVVESFKSSGNSDWQNVFYCLINIGMGPTITLSAVTVPMVWYQRSSTVSTLQDNVRSILCIMGN